MLEKNLIKKTYFQNIYAKTQIFHKPLLKKQYFHNKLLKIHTKLHFIANFLEN